MPEDIEKEGSIEGENVTQESVHWINNHRIHFESDAVLAQQARTIRKTQEILDRNLDIDPDRAKTIVEKSLNDFFEINHVSSVVRKFVLINLTKLMVLRYGESDPGGDWWQSFLRQSKEAQENLLSTLISCAGCWQTGFEIKNETETAGAKELQVSLSQALTDLSHILYNTSETELVNTELPFDNDIRLRLKKISSTFIQNTSSSNTPWSRNLDLINTFSKKSGDSQKFNPFIFALNGKLIAREIESFEDLPVRLYREINGHTQYLDLPAKTILTANSRDLQKTLTTIEAISQNWIEVAEFPDLSKPGPCISVSISGKPRPESLLYLHSRSGNSMIHLNYNPDSKEIESYFNHLNFDGTQGIDLALGMAEAVGTPEKPRLKGLWVDWQPPTQISERLNQDELDEVVDIIDHDASGINYQEDEAIINFVYSLSLSDITISNDLDPQKYKIISDLVSKINDTWHKDITDKIGKIIEEDVKDGKKAPSEKAKGEILNRLLATKMTVTKFMDIIGRDYYGPTSVCTVPRESFDPEVRLIVLNPPVLEKGEDADLEDLHRAYTDMICEYARTYLQNFSPIIALQNEMDQYRGTGEITSFLLTKDAFESAMQKIMFSHIKSVSRNGVALSKFTSALTTSFERDFALAVGDMPIKNDGENTLRYSHRHRATAKFIESLDIFDNSLNASIDEVANHLGCNQEEIQDIKVRTKFVREKLKSLINIHYPVSKKKTLPSIILLIADLLKNSNNHEDDYKCIQYLIISGMLKKQNDFYKTTSDRARAYQNKF
jgi:hypothetical protein